MKVSNVKESPKKNPFILVYGVSGIGKTSLATSCGDKCKVLLLDAESGLACLSKSSRADLVDYVSLARDDEGKVLEAEEKFKRLQEFVSNVRSGAFDSYDVIFIDSFTEITQNIMAHMHSVHGDGFKKWNEYAGACLDFLKFFRDHTRVPVVFTALEERVDEDDGSSYFFPNVGGKKVKEGLLPSFDVVARMIVDKEGKRLLVTHPTSKTHAKDRYGALTQTEEPVLENIINKVRSV